MIPNYGYTDEHIKAEQQRVEQAEAAHMLKLRDPDDWIAETQAYLDLRDIGKEA
ncbi:MAG TPA: hypothetical protein VK663_01835 [Burkholderiales bacterium]|nr:hypothetical protein [Burkholderiales bacterium]